MEPIRMNKFLAQQGVCSRREADRLITEGKVLLNGRVADLGDKVIESDLVVVGGKTYRAREEEKPEQVVYAYYKPVGVVCTEKDRHASKKVTDFVKVPVRVTYAGRLDKDSEGLLLMTNDGELINAMMRGSHEHEKEYIVKVDKALTDEKLITMSRGLYLKDLEITTRPCVVEQLGPYTFRIVLTQGLNRQIRRMCEACDLQVKSLKRVRVMNILLGKLKPGEYRKITDEEQKELNALLKK